MHTSPVVATGSLSFCVGVYPPLHTRSGDTVTVRFDTPSGVLTPSTAVGTNVTVDVLPGPFTVSVRGQRQLVGTLRAGETQAGSVGTGCPH
jgi:hypothetical protein